jgi:hypothetical protein
MSMFDSQAKVHEPVLAAARAEAQVTLTSEVNIWDLLGVADRFTCFYILFISIQAWAML